MANKTKKCGGKGWMTHLAFPVSCNTAKDCPTDAPYCVLFRNSGFFPFLHYFKGKAGQCSKYSTWWKWNKGGKHTRKSTNKKRTEKKKKKKRKE